MQSEQRFFGVLIAACAADVYDACLKEPVHLHSLDGEYVLRNFAWVVSGCESRRSRLPRGHNA